MNRTSMLLALALSLCAATALDKRWTKAFTRHEGGKAQADALGKRFDELVASTKTEIALRRMP